MGEKNGLFTYWEGTVTIHGAALAPIVEFLFWGFGAKRLASWGHAAARGDRYYLLWLESAAGIFEGCFHDNNCLTWWLSKYFLVRSAGLQSEPDIGLGQ